MLPTIHGAEFYFKGEVYWLKVSIPRVRNRFIQYAQ
jgi:hypothetical protein